MGTSETETTVKLFEIRGSPLLFEVTLLDPHPELRQLVVKTVEVRPPALRPT